MADTDLLALAERVERLAGPDREVENAIWYALHPGCKPTWGVRAYTASLDAGMTLVLEGYGFQIDGFGDHWWASLSEDEGFNAKAATPALALTAAALRARARATVDRVAPMGGAA